MRPRPACSKRRGLSRGGVGEAGQTITEYALILGLFALVVIVGLLVLAGGIGGTFSLFDDPSSPPSALRPPVASCDPNYEGACVPPYPPDIDCSDLDALGIDTVRVTGSDPHRLDPDHDGIGCG